MKNAYFGYFRPRQQKYPTTISVISDQFNGLTDHFGWNKLKRNIFNISKAKMKFPPKTGQSIKVILRLKLTKKWFRFGKR